MRYQLRANFDFEAESAGEALQKLQEHFLAILEPGQGYKELDFRGTGQLIRIGERPLTVNPSNPEAAFQEIPDIDTVWSKSNFEGGA